MVFGKVTFTHASVIRYDWLRSAVDAENDLSDGELFRYVAFNLPFVVGQYASRKNCIFAGRQGIRR